MGWRLCTPCSSKASGPQTPARPAGESKCNYQLLRDYGFTVPGNPNDRIPPLTASPAPQTSDTGNGSSGRDSQGDVGAYFSNAEDSAKAVIKGQRLNGLGLVEAAGMAGEGLCKGGLWSLCMPCPVIWVCTQF